MQKLNRFRGRFLALAAAAALGPAAAYGQGTMICQRVDLPVGAIRAEGQAELLPDIVLDCTGGTPTTAGSLIPPIEIMAITSVPLVNRQVTLKPPVTTVPVLDQPVPSTLLWNDAILLVDDALPAQQSVCVPAEAADSCPATPGPSLVNVFQGTQLQDNIVLFRHIPIDPPGLGHNRRIRITNLRVDASKVPTPVATTTPAKVVSLDSQIYDKNGNSLAIAKSQFSVPVLRGVTTSLRTPTDDPVLPGAPAVITTPVLLPQNSPGESLGFNIKFAEGFAGAFKRRNLATNGTTPNLLTNQANVTSPFNTESGFFNGKFPDTNDLNLAGLADTGTRLKLTISGVPDNVFFYANTRENAVGTTNYSAAAPKALLTYADENGQGPFQQTLSEKGDGYAIVQPNNGSVTITWEVVSADPDAIEELSFNVRLFAPNGIARLGLAEMVATLGPIYPGVTVQVIPTQAPFPSFVADPLLLPIPVFRVVPTISSNDFTSVSGASYAADAVAPGSIVAGFGSALSATTLSSSGAPVTKLGGVTVDVIDNHGVTHSAPLYLESASQINFLVPSDIPLGQAVVNVSNNNQTVAAGSVQIAAVAPGLFSATGDGQGLALGTAIQGTTSTLLTTLDAAGKTVVPVPITIGDNTYLTLYGTGIRGRSGLANVLLTVGGTPVPVTYAGAQPTADGLDQVNAGPLPASLRGSGKVDLQLTVDGHKANPLSIQIGN